MDRPRCRRSARLSFSAHKLKEPGNQRRLLPTSAACREPFGRGFEMTTPCAICGTPILKRSNNKYCSDQCRRTGYAVQFPPADPHRACRICGTVFIRIGQGQCNKQHCSEACAAISAKAARQRFARKRPEREKQYRDKQRAKRNKDTLLGRLWRKYPLLPRCCEACGESRVLEVAHRPEHARNGAWIAVRLSKPDMIWILCPLCHALLDRLHYSAEQLGIKPRVEPAPQSEKHPRKCNCAECKEYWRNFQREYRLKRFGSPTRDRTVAPKQYLLAFGGRS